MENQLLGTLIITTNVVLPSASSISYGKHVADISKVDYQHKTVKLHSYFGVMRSECDTLKTLFLSHNKYLDEDELVFKFEAIEFI
jgi:hypothetical protein